MMNKDSEPEFFPDIFEYLEGVDNSKSVNVKGLEEIIYRMHASTGLSKEACAAVLKLYFQEIRNAVLRGNVIVLNKFGKFLLAAPKTANNKIKIFPKFVLFKSFKNKLNKL